MRSIVFITLFLLSFFTGSTQTNVWSTLAMVKFIEDPAGNMGASQFEDLIKNMEGSEIKVKGYIIPLEGKRAQSHFMFSAYPYNMCFFCGKAGPETVMEVYMENGEKVEFTEKSILLKGTFYWQPNTLNDIMFVLEKARKI